jgi:CRP/FNR family transcriptional regulator
VSREGGVFAGLNEDSLRFLAAHRSSHRYRKGQVLFHEGTPSLGLFCVQSGKVKCYKTQAEGKLYIIKIAESGEMLGLESLVSGASCSMTAEMLEDGSICFFDRITLLDLVRRNPTASLNLIDTLGREVRLSYSERTGLAYSAVRARMARLLALLTRTHGIPGGDGIRIDLPLSREEFAEMIGTAPETAIRLLSEFRRQHLVRLDGKRIRVLDPERLLEMGRIVED